MAIPGARRKTGATWPTACLSDSMQDDSGGNVNIFGGGVLVIVIKER
jgi:hypothetical protein